MAVLLCNLLYYNFTDVSKLFEADSNSVAVDSPEIKTEAPIQHTCTLMYD